VPLAPCPSLCRAPSPGLLPLIQFSRAQLPYSLPPLSLPRGALGFGDADRWNLDPRGVPPPLSPLPLLPPLPHPTRLARPYLAVRPHAASWPRPPRASSVVPRAAPWSRPPRLRPHRPRPTPPPRPRPARRLGPRVCAPAAACLDDLAPRAPTRLACPRRALRHATIHFKFTFIIELCRALRRAMFHFKFSSDDVCRRAFRRAVLNIYL
jgi:hypothetical protein